MPSTPVSKERMVLLGAIVVLLPLVLWLLSLDFGGVQVSDSTGKIDALTVSRFEGTLSERQSGLASLSPVEVEVLRRRQQKYESLSTTRREQVEQFHEALMAHPAKAELQATMDRYYQWLRTLDQKDQLAIMDLSTEERLEKIKSIREDQIKASFGLAGATKLPQVDEEWVKSWILKTVADKKERIDELLNQPDVKSRLPRLALNTGRPARSSRLYNYRFSLLAMHAPEYARELVFEGVDELKSRLSKEALKIINNREIEDQKELLLQWFVAACLARERIDDEKLFDFFQQLRPEQQASFEMYSREMWRSELQAYYQQQTKLKELRDRKGRNPARRRTL